MGIDGIPADAFSGHLAWSAVALAAINAFAPIFRLLLELRGRVWTARIETDSQLVKLLREQQVEKDAEIAFLRRRLEEVESRLTRAIDLRQHNDDGR